MSFFRAIKRIGAFIAGIFLTIAGVALVYESFTGTTDNPLFSKISWFVLLFGLGMFFYSFSSPEKKPEAPANTVEEEDRSVDGSEVQ